MSEDNTKEAYTVDGMQANIRTALDSGMTLDEAVDEALKLYDDFMSMDANKSTESEETTTEEGNDGQET